MNKSIAIFRLRSRITFNLEPFQSVCNKFCANLRTEAWIRASPFVSILFQFFRKKKNRNFFLPRDSFASWFDFFSFSSHKMNWLNEIWLRNDWESIRTCGDIRRLNHLLICTVQFANLRSWRCFFRIDLPLPPRSTLFNQGYEPSSQTNRAFFTETERENTPSEWKRIILSLFALSCNI